MYIKTETGLQRKTTNLSHVADKLDHIQ